MKGEIAAKNTIDQYEWIILGGLLLLAFSIHIYSTFGGLIWTSDSFQYWAASRSFKTEMIFIAADEGSYAFWPPLFPVILSFFDESLYEAFHLALFLSSLLIIYLFFKKLYYKRVALCSISIFIVSVYPYLMSSFLWSETIFTLLLYSGLFFYRDWIQEKQNIFSLIIASILFALMCLQRNAGVFIIIGLSVYALFIFLQDRKYLLLFKIAILHLLIVAPNIAWNTYQKYKYPEEFNFSNRPFAVDFLPNLQTLSYEFSRLLSPIGGDTLPLLALIMGLLVLFIVVFKKTSTLIISILSTYVILYLAMPKFEPSEIGRFLAPITPIIILQLVLFSKNILSRVTSRKLKWLLSGILALILLYNIARTTKNVVQWNYRSIHNPKSAKIFF